MTIRALVIDDEFLARQRVIKLLETHDQIKVLGEAKNGQEAVDLIRLKQPDLLFLDVQMPDFDGFEVIKRIQGVQMPYIIFTTAYDQYAIKAFDIHALDYLLKPIDEERFQASIRKVATHFQSQRTTDFNKELLKMIQTFHRSDQFLDHLIITDRGREFEVDLDEVLYFEANGNYVNLFTQNKTHLYRTTMNALAEQLNPEEFIRIHRSLILNKRYIGKCTYTSNNEYRFTLKNGQELASGRSFKQDVMVYLNQS
ncbi:MAG: LytTR family DNA-binding domain-containing protein [Cytophagales bacterium]|nr:LytTR family DNA-binding domain-containing protein [Cytophagales bacterium]